MDLFDNDNHLLIQQYKLDNNMQVLYYYILFMFILVKLISYCPAILKPRHY